MYRAILSCGLALAVAIPVASYVSHAFGNAEAAFQLQTARLAGFDCEGANGRVLYRKSESAFPQCRAIERLDGPAAWTFSAYDESGTWQEILYGRTLRDCLKLELSKGREYAETRCEKGFS